MGTADLVDRVALAWHNRIVQIGCHQQDMSMGHSAEVGHMFAGVGHSRQLAVIGICYHRCNCMVESDCVVESLVEGLRRIGCCRPVCHTAAVVDTVDYNRPVEVIHIDSGRKSHCMLERPLSCCQGQEWKTMTDR